jgi:DNA transformation protein
MKKPPDNFSAFVVDQLSDLDGIEAKPMFGGVGLYVDGSFFGILYQQHLYFRVSADSIGDYKKLNMKPFKPFEGKKGPSKNYYQVPVEILESPRDLVAWAKKAVNAAEKTR